MDTVVNAGPVETLYMTVPRAEMRKLTAERDGLRNEIAQLKAQLACFGVQQPVARTRPMRAAV